VSVQHGRNANESPGGKAGAPGDDALSVYSAILMTRVFADPRFVVDVGVHVHIATIAGDNTCTREGRRSQMTICSSTRSQGRGWPVTKPGTSAGNSTACAGAAADQSSDWAALAIILFSRRLRWRHRRTEHDRRVAYA
jgi:hypothetical protein